MVLEDNDFRRHDDSRRANEGKIVSEKEHYIVASKKRKPIEQDLLEPSKRINDDTPERHFTRTLKDILILEDMNTIILKGLMKKKCQWERGQRS